MKLRERVPKTGPTREVTTRQTLERVTPLLRTVGVTRVADITWLDRIGIPVYNAIVPRSHDLLSVYNGKGRTHDDARASAIMEAVERFAAWQPRTPDLVATYTDLEASGQAVLNPADHNLAPGHAYRPDVPISWTRGYDLLREEPVLVPLSLAGYYIRFHEIQCFAINTSNGLASGNSLEEAICHALCEVIERDALTMADLVSNRITHMMRNKLGAAAPPAAVTTLEDSAPSVDLTTLPDAARWFAERIQEAGLPLVIRDITSSLGIPTFAAMVSESLAETFSPSHSGYGTHPHAEVAVIRALTELAQSRAVDIQGMREDISLPSTEIDNWNHHVSRGGSVDRSVWPWRESASPVRFGDVRSYPNDDVMADIRFMLERLRDGGLKRAIVVDRTPPGFPVHVVRVIVPGLESWAIDQSKLGPRAKAHWNEALRVVAAPRARVANAGVGR
ncbi:ribosomal protein S12 methylthiotransferase accessory factor [Micromonospora citrea]|uniref:Ribosomal protein S12 methylthiotransferase accessory factor n=1 Tax=Micromonospora citrea TaxID=47855 RepID=A0A1C6TT33_9ACTN|nr:YcaO-like family protein [Micromonospora citrea]SCL44829.1 ribosomal protein S12 methylthiotransferase accessory factor [Micromonospora citrea]